MKELFDCKCCGHCCTGKGGIVVSPSDRERLCRHLGVEAHEFEERWGEQRGGKLHVRTGSDNACIFFAAGTGCSVHVAKPDICRAWPYFRGNLIDAASFELAKDFCPGIPAHMAHEDFVREGLACLTREHLAGADGQGEARALQVADILENLAKNDKKR